MSKQSNLRGVVEAVSVVLVSFFGAVLIISLLMSNKSDGTSSNAMVVDNSEQNTQPVAQVAVAAESPALQKLEKCFSNSVT